MTALPDVPAFEEVGVDLVGERWWGLMAPARIPAAILEKATVALRGTRASAAIQPRMDALAVLPRATGTADFETRLRADLTRIARSKNIRAQ